MKQQTVHLGFEVGTGEPVTIPVAHMAVTGQTQLSGKTTTLSALVLRSGVTAIAFSTKRGEGAFGLRQIEFDQKEVWTEPFFKQRAGWQFVSDILGAVLNEKLKHERYWIMEISRRAKSLKDVQENAKSKMKAAKRAWDMQILTTIVEYFDLFMPELEKLPYSNELVLEDGCLNIMDLSSYSTPLQMLVIAAVLDEVYQHRKNTVVMIPEAWEFVPNGKSSPVKSAAISLVRKGAGLKNFLWLDSQDLASLEPEIRRACSVWILGVQREQNEVKRLLAHIPAGTSKPKVEDVMQLERGQFFACHAKEVRKTYVQPAWMDNEDARNVSLGSEMVKAPETTKVTWKIQHMNSKTGETVDRIPGKVELASDDDPTVDKLEVGDKLRFRDAGGNEVSAGDTVLYAGGKPAVSGFRGLEYRTDPACPPDTILPINPERLPPFDESKYLKPPQGVAVIIDGDQHHSIFMPAHHSKVRDNEVDQQERQQFQSTIQGLRQDVERLLELLPARQRNEYHDALKREQEARGDLDLGTATGIHAMTMLQADQNAELRANAKIERDDMKDWTEVPWYMTLLEDSKFIRALSERLPRTGVVEVKPREYVLKKWQNEEVKRILDAVAGMSVWQRQVLQFVVAKGGRVDKKQLVVSILGRQTINMARDFKDEYKEVDELVAAGYLRNDNGRAAPNLEKCIREKLAPYEPTDDEIEATIGTVLNLLG